MSRTVELRIGGQNYRVVSSAPEEELLRLAAVVNAKLAEVGPGRATAPQAMLLAAMSLAHDAESERGLREVLERRTRDLLKRAIERVDEALAPADGASDGLRGV